VSGHIYSVNERVGSNKQKDRKEYEVVKVIKKCMVLFKSGKPGNRDWVQ